MDQRFCTTCGHHLGDGDLFCTACGAQVVPPSGAATSLSPAPAAETPIESPLEATSIRGLRPVPPPSSVPVGRSRRSRSRARFWGWIATAAVVVGALSYGLGTLVDQDVSDPAVGPNGSVGPAGDTTAPSRTRTPSPKPSADPAATAQAKALYALISQSASDKEKIAVAAGQLQRCDHIEQAIQTFEEAAASRDRLVERAAGLQVGLLPGGGAAIADLSAAARAAADADRAYVAWGESRHLVRLRIPQHGKHHGKHHPKPRFREVCRGGADLEARAVRLSTASHGAKQETATAWNLVAAQFGLPTITWTKL